MIGFTAPWLLLALLALPALWYFLRSTPPAPRRLRFAAVALLLGLRPRAREVARMPWWLLALRLLAAALVIVGFAGPVLGPQPLAQQGQAPLLIVADSTWAAAPVWPRHRARAEQALAEAEALGRPVALLSLTAPAPVVFLTAEEARLSLPRLAPRPRDIAPDLELRLPEGRFDTLWLSDGLAPDAGLLKTLQARGALRVSGFGPVLALAPARVEQGPEGSGSGGALVVPLRVAGALPPEAKAEVLALGRDPAGVERVLARVEVALNTDAPVARFALPPELRNRIARFELAPSSVTGGVLHAGAVSLTDDRAKRRKVALVEAGAAREGLELLAPAHYLRQALAPHADLIEGALADVLAAKPDVIVLPDVAALPQADQLADWVDEGGLLLRFGGPRMANADLSADALLPVALRAGGRAVGGTLSWGAPRRLAPFAPSSPFAGLVPPEEVVVRGQLVAEPSPDLADHVIAALEDGTPLVTRARFGAGAVVLFHVSANAEWSSLPLSGLYEQMLARLVEMGGQAGPQAEGELAAGVWAPEALLSAQGALLAATGESRGVEAQALALALSAPRRVAPAAGLYHLGERVVALNILTPERGLQAAVWPATAVVESAEAPPARPLKGLALGMATGLWLLDMLALFLLGAGFGTRQKHLGKHLGSGAALLIALALLPPPAQAQSLDLERATAIAAAVTLGYIETGEPEVDQLSQAGLDGLGQTLANRTTVEPAPAQAVDLDADDLALFTLLYWPVTEAQPLPTPQAYLKLERFLRGGGMILFDTRDADLPQGAGQSLALQRLTAPLSIPPLEPAPADHILTRSFYLLQSFPGRYEGAVWVEAVGQSGAQTEVESAPQANDGVTPVVIGGNDWAAAWAVDARGQPLVPVGRGMAGERQREMALRFGVNLVMHVLTGNYKADQVHVPQLLERLGK